MLQLWPNSLDNTVSFASRKIVKLMQKGEKDLYYTRSKEGNIRGERRNMLSKIYVKWTVYDLFQDWQSRATMMYKRPKNIYKAPKNRVETEYTRISPFFSFLSYFFRFFTTTLHEAIPSFPSPNARIGRPNCHQLSPLQSSLTSSLMREGSRLG